MITKIQEFTEQDFNDLENIGNIESIGNAHYFFSSFLKSSDKNRRENNPHNINYELMIKEFGNPNFEDDYKSSSWWALKLDNLLFFSQ